MDGSSTSEVDVRVAAIVSETDAEGPGRRFAVWVQGCAIRCDGCFNPHMWSSLGGVSTSVDHLLDQVSKAKVEGVTLLGGEPFEQAEALSVFARGVRSVGLSVMTFSGHDFWHLVGPAAPAGSSALLESTDLLVTGPYLASHPDLARPWVGSTNQEFHFLTRRYEHIRRELADLPDKVEVRIGTDGSVSVNGWAAVAQLDELLTGFDSQVGRGRIR